MSKIFSYTHVDGIYTANPEWVNNAKIIERLHYKEAAELANFGANILHKNTIEPLIEEGISLHILNTFNPSSKGTIISSENDRKGIRALAFKDNIVLIHLIGKGLLGKIGIDARIFNSLRNINVSVNLISQSSSETSISLIVDRDDHKDALRVLRKEFEIELLKKEIGDIYADVEVGLITIIGQEIINFSETISSLKRNDIKIKMLSNTIQDNNISIIVSKSQTRKAANIIHAKIFGISKNINVAVFGKGTVGKPFIQQIIEERPKLLKKKKLDLNIFAVAGTQHILLQKEGVNGNWDTLYQSADANKSGPAQVIEFAHQHQLENLIAIDNTGSNELVNEYGLLIENGFDLISSNKIANTESFEKYQDLRTKLTSHNKEYLYETNVGAGLPIINTIRLLHESGENIVRIRGVFSGSLSYVFNEFSSKSIPFSQVLKEAVKAGLTEPDPREDLCGLDVARKLLILARELDLKNEITDVEIDNLVPTSLREVSQEEFFNRIEDYDHDFDVLKNDQDDHHVLRYVADLGGDLQQEKGELSVKLVSVSEFSQLGNLKGSDSLIEIFTESYGDQPIVIQGAGAGPLVTARGVFGDLLRIAEKK